MEYQPSPSNSDAKGLSHQNQCGIKRNCLDYQEFACGELETLRKHKIGSPFGHDQIDYETAFIHSLERRIISLEKQLEQKQTINEKLLINNNTQVQALLQQDKAMKPPTTNNFIVNTASFNGLNCIETEKNGERAK